MQPPQGPYDPNAYPPAAPQWTQMPPPYQGGNGAGQTPPPGQLPPPAQIAPPYQQPAGYAPEGAPGQGNGQMPPPPRQMVQPHPQGAY